MVRPDMPAAPLAPAPPGPPAPLDQALPDQLTGRGQTWLTRYRRYPVFSPMWVRWRWLAFGFWLSLVVVPMAVSVVSAAPADRPWGGFAQAVLELALPLALGPVLGLWVRRRGWTPRREFIGLCLAMLGTTALLLGLRLTAAEPAKQWLAERMGVAQPGEPRPRVQMTIGINVGRRDAPPVAASAPSPASSAAPAAGSAAGSAPGSATAVSAASAAASGMPGPDSDDDWITGLNHVLRVLLAFWLAGGVALWGWQREQRGLAGLRAEQALKRAEAQRREAELRLSVLAAQVEPHFLFNTLAGVRSAIATDPARASDMIDHLVDYLRASIPRLRSDGAADATLGQQLDSVRAYLGLIAARMPRLRFEVAAAPALLPLHCPPLMLISLAENAVKHGVEPKIGAAQIQVGAMVLDDGRLAITVADDGVGFGASTAGSGIGLANIRERLQQLYGDRAALALKARPEGGVAATLTLPLEQPVLSATSDPQRLIRNV